MKKLAKLLSLILALALVFALVGCDSNNNDDDDDDSKPSSSASDKENDKKGDKNDKNDKTEIDDKDDEDDKKGSDKKEDTDSIIGTWKSDSGLGEYFNMMLEGSGLEEIFDFDDVEIALYLTFDDDVLTMEFDEDDIADSYDALIDIMIEGTIATLEAELGDGYDFEELLEMAGTSIDELKEEVMAECPYEDWEEIFAELNGEYNYELEDGIIYNEGDEVGEFDGDTVVLDLEGIIIEFERA